MEGYGGIEYGEEMNPYFFLAFVFPEKIALIENKVFDLLCLIN